MWSGGGAGHTVDYFTWRAPIRDLLAISTPTSSKKSCHLEFFSSLSITLYLPLLHPRITSLFPNTPLLVPFLLYQSFYIQSICAYLNPGVTEPTTPSTQPPKRFTQHSFSILITQVSSCDACVGVTEASDAGGVGRRLETESQRG